MVSEIEQQFTNWQVADWDELVSIWSALVPEPMGEEGQIVRTFRGREISNQDAGLVFEQWILECFRLSGAEVQPPFASPTPDGSQVEQQIDGLVVCDWQAFLVESKFWPREGKVDFGPIVLLHHRCEQRPPNTMGLIFSPFGFTVPAFEQARRMRPLRVLLFVRSDLEWAIAGRNFVELVRQKWVTAVKYGDPGFRVDKSKGATAND